LHPRFRLYKQQFLQILMEILSIVFIILIPLTGAFLPLPEKTTLQLNENIPYVIKGGCKDVDAVKRWSSDYLIKHSQNSNINYYNNTEFYDTGVEDRTKYKMKLKDFILEKSNYKYISEFQAYDLPKKLFDDTFDEHETYYHIIAMFLSMGYNKTGSRFHLHVTNDFTVCLIFGEKEMVFFDPVEAHVPIDNILLVATNKSYVTALHKSLFETKHYPNLYKTTLVKGDLLYVPPWWYHNAINKEFTAATTSIYYRTDLSYVFYSYKFALPAIRDFFLVYFNAFIDMHGYIILFGLPSLLFFFKQRPHQ